MAAREFWRIDALEREDRSAAGASATEGPTDFHKALVREINSRILRHLEEGRMSPDEDVWPSSGEEPEQFTPPALLLRGGGRNEESEESPRGPKIIAQQVLTGPRVVIKRLEKVTVEESERVADVEMASDDSAPRSTTNCEVYEASSEEERVRSELGPSKPLKRARGRLRKDGSGPFRPNTPSIPEVVDMALNGEIPDLTLTDLVPIANRSRVRQGDKRGYVIRSDDSDVDDPTDPRAEKSWLRALGEIASGKASQIAAIGLEAIEKVDRARQRSKNIKGLVMHDLRVGARIARQACLVPCQHTSRFGAQQATADALAESQAKETTLERENERLRINYQVAENSREYLLKLSRGNSRNPSPVEDSAPRGRGTKRSVSDRRGVSPARSPSYEWAVMGQDPPPFPEVVMADPAGDQNRSLSPMARFAAADPQVTGVLQDIVQSLKRLEGRLEALEGRRGPGPAPDKGVGVLVPLPAPLDERKPKRKRTKKKRGTAPTLERLPEPARTPGGVATPRGATASPTGSRTGPLGPIAKMPKAASGKKGVSALKRVASTPGAKGRASVGTAPVAEAAGASSSKKGKKVGKEVGVETPTPVPSRRAARALPPVTPTTPASAVRPADEKASTWKTAGRRKKAAG